MKSPWIGRDRRITGPIPKSQEVSKMNEDWDKIADDEDEWSDPVLVERGSKRPEAVLSVRLPAELADQVRLQAESSGVKVGTFLRRVVEEAVSGKPGDVVYLRYHLDASRRQVTSGHVEIVRGNEDAAATG
jgi:predicted DNA binding CopG/RHH family protein